MYENLTVDQAISRGQRMINYPSLAFFMILTLGSITYSTVYHVTAWVIAPGVVLGILLSWLYWSLTITKWRLWAFKNVRNVHELQRKALEVRLIKPEGSFLEKTEIRTEADKEKGASLQPKFSQEDVYSDDYSLPEETLIYYSKPTEIFMIMLSLCGIAGGIFLLTEQSYLGAAVLLVICGFLAYKSFKRAIDNRPQIIINNKGIETISAGFTEWKDVTNDIVITRQEGKSSNTYLEYSINDRSIQVNIGELKVKKKALENMLHVYRVRSENHSHITTRSKVIQ